LLASVVAIRNAPKRSESGALRAEVRASDVETAKEILRRAIAFAGKQGQ